MTLSQSSAASPLRVAIIGSGPSAFYAAEHLQKQAPDHLEIDMFERLPTPYGLVRGGVAPDHAKIKAVTSVYDRIASEPGFHYYGGVTFGRDLTHDDLVAHYHAVIYAVGAQTDRRMNIPGEDLPGSHPATEFVGWYNAHPDFRDLEFDLSQERVAVIGNGNVAMDVARILAQTADELFPTDIADYALDALSHSRVKEIIVLGRRGPAQTKFTAPELREMQHLKDADVFVDPAELVLDPLSAEFINQRENRLAAKNVELLREFAVRGLTGKSRRITFRFLLSPVEIIGTDRVEAVRVNRNEICVKEHFLSPCPTDEMETIPVGLVFRSIGYLGVPLPGVPFDSRRGTIPNEWGRVLSADKTPLPGEYVVGWIKRGPSGIIGTNKPDAQETVAALLEDVGRGQMLSPAHPSREFVEALLRGRGVRYVTYDDWRILDHLEQERGEAVGRPRLKFSRIEDMFAALDDYKHTIGVTAAR